MNLYVNEKPVGEDSKLYNDEVNLYIPKESDRKADFPLA